MTTTSDRPAGALLSIDESYPAVPDAVAEARRSVSRWLGALSADALMSGDIGVAVSEACTNVVHHGYRTGSSGTFRVRAESVEGAVCVTVSDDGGGILPRSDSPGMGLGLPLMGLLTDELEIATADDGTGTVVCMHFTAAGAHGRLAAR
jgi:serine/threonine-protein kinase RsbW/stage II sporulation protein AB (anti-sigma F factor)